MNQFFQYSGIITWIIITVLAIIRLIFGKRWLLKISGNAIIGRGLIKSTRQLIKEVKKRDIQEETVASVGAHVLWRLTRIGIIGLLIAAFPIWLLMQQNSLVRTQNELFSYQNERVDRQTALLESQTRLLENQNKKFDRQNSLFEDQNSKVTAQTGFIEQQTDLFKIQIRQFDEQISQTESEIDLLRSQDSLFRNQNDFVKKQTELFGTQISQVDEQNRLLLREDSLIQEQIVQVEIQNELLEKQTNLSEAERRSSLNFLLGNLLDQINRELKGSNLFNRDRSLSSETIGRIAGLSQSFKPYRYLNGDSLISNPLSPERGQLLVALINSRISRKSYLETFLRSDFSAVDLKNANLAHANLRLAVLSGGNLSGANLFMADLRSTNLASTNLRKANLGLAKLGGIPSKLNVRGGVDRTNVSYDVTTGKLLQIAPSRMITSLTGADLTGADLTFIQFAKVILNKAVLIGANLKAAYFIDSDLSEVNFTGAKGLTANQLINAKSLYASRGIDPKVKEEILKAKPCLFIFGGCK